MSSITEQFSAATKSQLEAQFQIFNTLATTAVGSAEKVFALIADASADREVLMSNQKFAERLLSYGVAPPMKVSPTTGKPALALAKNDEGFKALAEHEDERVQALVAARLGTKSTLEETRTERFLDIAQRGPLPIPLKYFAAHTSRWGGMDLINLQNLPSRGENAGKLKSSILPPPGYVIIDADSAQIEARILAWLAGQTDLVEAFRNKQDVYSIMASFIYAKPVDQITKQERFVGKTVILGCGYGTGAAKLQAFLKGATPSIEMTLDECRQIVITYRAKYFKIPDLWSQGDTAIAAAIDGQTAPFGKPGVIKLAFGMLNGSILGKLSFEPLLR